MIPDMKKFKNIITGVIFLSAVWVSSISLADTPPPPPDHNSFGGGSQVGGVPGGGAPVGEGVFLLAIMGLAYGGYRFQRNRKPGLAN